jgi:glycosyltransferase involved in cell wall biosynthesis
LKVLLSALACEPEKGSEPEVGFRTVLAAASRHEVWVLTASESLPAIRKALRQNPRVDAIHLEGLEFGVSPEQIIHLNAIDYHRRYDRWQRAAAERAQALDRDVDFDLVHHATLASYWTRAGVSIVDKPLLWGPVGGGVDPPLRLVTELGPRGTVEALARVLLRPLIARLPPVQATQRVADLILAQNPGTGRRLKGRRPLVLLSNALSMELDEIDRPAPHLGQRNREIVFAGRLLPWKAPILALRALRYVTHDDAVLRFCGDGPEQARLERAASKWGLSNRVRFEGWLPRRKLLSLLGSAGVLIHPSVHDEAPLCIAEALALGTPVVCLDHGGPPEIITQWRGPSALISPRGPESTASSMAAAVDRFLADPPPILDRPVPGRTSFRDEVLRAYEVAVATAG